MAELFGRQISLNIAPGGGPSKAKVEEIRGLVKFAGQMYPTREAAFKALTGLKKFFGVWKFSETQWGLVTDREVRILQGPSSVEGKQFKDQRISFKIKKTSDGKPNKANIQLYNPNPDTISLVQSRGAVVQLFAGYDFPWMLFRGNPVKDGINIERNGPDRILRIEANDGGRALALTRLDLNFGENTTLKQALNAVAIQSGLGVGFVGDVEDFDLPYGMRLEGSPAEALERIAQISGADFSIQDNAIQILKQEKGTDEPAVLFSTANGNLLRVARKEKGRVAVTSMLEGSIRPGRRFVCASEYINGFFKAIDVEHTGDLWEDAFTTQITARPWKPPTESERRIAAIKAAVVKLQQMFSSYNEAQARAKRIDLRAAAANGNLFVAKFSSTEWGLVPKNTQKELQAAGVSTFKIGEQGAFL
jgi:hypothetical protein